MLTDVAARAGLEQTALLPADQNALPDPSSHGYIEPAGVEELADVGATKEAGTDVTDWSLSWGGAGGGMYSTVEDLFEWAATGSGTSLLDDDLARSDSPPPPTSAPTAPTAWASSSSPPAGSATSAG